MNTSLTAYTHLESLLLFQSLNAYGVGHNIFSRISELLKNNPTITADKRFQSGRLSPDALRNFYLHILKEEIKNEQRQQGPLDAEGQNGEVKNSRKRKAPSPTLPTVQEAAQHTHLIPKLVTKLYARYRTALTHEIRDDEDRYERLRRELQSIERGERDGELVERANGKSPAPRSPSLSKKSPLPQQKPPPPSPSPQLAAQDGGRRATPVADAHVSGRPQQADPEAQIPPSPSNGQIPVDLNGNIAPSPSLRKKHTTAPSTPQPPLSSAAPLQNHHPQLSAPPSPFPQSQAQNVANNAPPPHAQKPPYLHQGQLGHQGPLLPGTPYAVNQPPLSQTQSPATVPSSGAPYQNPSLQPHAGNGVPPHNQTSGVPPQVSPNQRLQGPHQTGPQSPAPHAPHQQRNVYPFPPQPPHSAQHPQAGQPPPQGGFMLPPFQVSPQDPSRAHQHPPLPQYPHVSTPVGRQPPSLKSASGSSSRQGLPPLQPPIFASRGSISTPIGAQTPQSATGTPRSAKSLWKPMVKNFGTPPAPRPEPEPLDDVVPVDSAKQNQPKGKSARKPRAKAKGKEKEADKESDMQREPEEPDGQVPEMEPRRGRSLRKGTSRRTRRGSITSSQAGGSTQERSRSPSIISHTETIAAENDSQAGIRVKSERGTSIDVIEEDSVATPTQPTTRRRGAMHSQPKGRKRTAREASLAESEDQPLLSPGMPKTVIAPRHFSRMCNPIMHDIGSHKHASMFSTAVKTKDAEGYYDIIKRPTDLKSIQKAIAAGARAVAAAATDTPAGSPGGGGGVVELPLTPDVMPPKAIVNSAQLEKELMRMFVNAVMFNAGEDGVVQDAREMFESCQQSVSNWRSVEPSNGKLEVEETPGPEEEAPAVASSSKRRKL